MEKIQKSSDQRHWPERSYGSRYFRDSDVEIFNPELHIATLEENATLIMEINLARGRGYVPAEMNKDEKHPDFGNPYRFDFHTGER